LELQRLKRVEDLKAKIESRARSQHDEKT
jgi:hypothetical protein